MALSAQHHHETTAPPAKFETYPVDLRATTTVDGVRLRLSVLDPRTHLLVRNLAIVHERPMHLFVVGDGLDFFAHEHPVQQHDGVFMVNVRLPRPGPYMAVAEFVPERGTPQTFQQLFTTAEAFDRHPPPAVDLAPKVLNGVRVIVDATSVRAGDTRPVVFHLAHADSGAPVTDLEPYLGAAAHLLLVPVDMTEAVHGHPADDLRGPDVSFTPLVPRAGRYKLWLQFQRAGRVSTASFVVDVS